MDRNIALFVVCAAAIPLWLFVISLFVSGDSLGGLIMAGVALALTITGGIIATRGRE